jgi:hypothetical protein
MGGERWPDPRSSDADAKWKAEIVEYPAALNPNAHQKSSIIAHEGEPPPFRFNPKDQFS